LAEVYIGRPFKTPDSVYVPFDAGTPDKPEKQYSAITEKARSISKRATITDKKKTRSRRPSREELRRRLQGARWILTHSQTPPQ
jgi:hypothetical protein